MRPKTIIMLLVIVALIAIVMALVHNPNSGLVFGGIPKGNMAIAAIVLAFILGFMAGRPGRDKKYRYMYDEGNHYNNPDTLSDEDREYIG